MAVSVKEVYAGLLAQVAAYTATSTSKGFPDWGRSAASLPASALELANVTPAPANRIGSAHARQALALRIYIFGRNEPELCDLLQTLLDLLREQASLTISGQRVELAFVAGERLAPQVGVQQEQHAFTVQVAASWSVTTAGTP